jgi:hypothetical protein
VLEKQALQALARPLLLHYQEADNSPGVRLPNWPRRAYPRSRPFFAPIPQWLSQPSNLQGNAEKPAVFSHFPVNNF